MFSIPLGDLDILESYTVLITELEMKLESDPSTVPPQGTSLPKLQDGVYPPDDSVVILSVGRMYVLPICYLMWY
jgi:hypothetical protein